MGLFDDVLAEQGVSPVDVPFVQPSGVYFKDADTFVTPDGKTVRLINANAYETQKTGKTAGAYSGSQTGSEEQLKIAKRVAFENGFNKPVLSGKKDKYLRELGDLMNDKGETFSQYMISNGLMDQYMPGPDVNSQDNVGELERARRQSQGIENIADKYLEALNVVRHEDPLMAKIYANSAKQYGASLDERGQSDVYTGGAIQHGDEDYKGEAKSNLSTGWSSGSKQMWGGAWSALDILGSVTGSKSIQNYAESNARGYRDDIRNLPELRNGEAFDENGKWKLDSFSKMADFAIGNAAASAPQMLFSMAGHALAAPTFGLSEFAPAVIFAGQTWENQKEKNAGWAIASGVTQQVLEAFGMQQLTGNIFKKATQSKVIEELIKKGMTRTAAEQLIIDEAQNALTGIGNFARVQALKEAKQTAEHIAARQIPARMLEGVISEAPTEGLQEITQYFGEQAGFKLPDNPEDMQALKNRVMNSITGGAVLGGSMAGAGTAVRNLATRADGRQVTPDAVLREKIMSQFGYIPTAEEVAKDALNDQQTNGTFASLDSLAAGHAAHTSVVGSISDWVSQGGVHQLWDKWSNVLKGTDTEGNYVNSLWALIGSSRAIGGGSIEEQQKAIHNELQNKFGSPDELRAAFGDKSLTAITSILSRPEVKAAVERIDRLMRARNQTAAQVAPSLDLDRTLGAFAGDKAGVIHYADRLNNLLKQYNEITKPGVAIGRMTVNDFMNLQPVNRTAVQRNPSEFTALLVKHLGISRKEAEEATNRISNDMDMQTILDPFNSMYNSSANASAIHTSLDQLMQTNPGLFAKFVNNNPVENAYALTAKGAASFVNKNLIGQDGDHLAALLNQAIMDKEISPERAAYVASQLKDWLAMRRGTYHEITNKYAKGALAVVNFLSTVSALPLAAISSTTEFAQIYRNLNLPQSLKATMALLKGSGAEIMNVVQSIGSRKKHGMVQDYRNTLFSHGFSAEGDIGRRNDVVTGYFQKWTEGFFKMTGLTSVTNVTRYAKLAIGRDAMSNWLDTAQNAPDSEAGKAARDHLVRVGMDVDWIFSVDRQSSDPAIKARMEKEFLTGMYNFTTEAVIHPTKMNRPKFYNDPYLQLFTQFQGYVSAFTANILPRLLKDVRSNGSPDQVNAAATIAMMLAIAYFALYAKDLIKYGESPPKWLKEEKSFQRYIGQSGLLGSGQRVWDAASPVVPQPSSSGVLSKIAKNVSNEAPALAYIGKVDEALSAPSGSQIKKTVKILPIVSTSTQFADYMQKELGGQ